MTTSMQRSRWVRGTAHRPEVGLNPLSLENRSLMHEVDPYKAAKAWYELATMKDPPLRCVTGTDAFARMQTKLDGYTANHKRFEKLSNSTDVDGYKAPS
jgi:hypothetical protein